MGLVADFGYDYQIDNIKSKTDAAKHEASPLIHIYLSSGFIVTYALTNCDELKKYPVVHASQSLTNLKIEELAEEKKEPIVEKVEITPTIEEKPKDSPVPEQKNITEVISPVKEEKPVETIIPEVKKSPEVTKQPSFEQPKIQFTILSSMCLSSSKSVLSSTIKIDDKFNWLVSLAAWCLLGMNLVVETCGGLLVWIGCTFLVSGL